MSHTEYSPRRDVAGTGAIQMSRRAAVGASGLTFLGLLAGSAFGREDAGRNNGNESREETREPAREAAHRRMPERLRSQSPPLFEQMRGAGSMEERMKMMQDWQLQRTLEKLKSELVVSEEEWTVIRPRIETVHRLMHAQPSFGGNAQGADPVAQKTHELRELLLDKNAATEEIQARLTALRGVKERHRQELFRARQDLRQIMTVRQEAVLVLNGLLE